MFQFCSQQVFENRLRTVCQPWFGGGTTVSGAAIRLTGLEAIENGDQSSIGLPKFSYKSLTSARLWRMHSVRECCI
jgi:hypothetical protein